MSNNSIIGRFEGNTSFRTSTGLITLTSTAPQSGVSVSANPFEPAREFEGQYAILSGTLQKKVLYGAEITELVPPTTSAMITKLIEGKILDMKRLRTVMEEANLTVVGEEPVHVESSPTAKVAIPSAGPLPLCALVVGHRKSVKGTRATTEPKTWEWDYNNEMAKLVAARVKNAEIEIVYRDDVKDGYTKLPAKINAAKPRFIVALHCNAVSDPKPGGTEMLYFHTSKASKKLAGLLQKKVLAVLGLSNRKLKPKSSGRGTNLLRNTNAPAVITEPFFMSNPSDWKVGRTKKNQLADAYARAIDEYAAGLTTGTKSKVVDKPFAPKAEGADSKSIRLQHSGLTKKQFFQKNRKDLGTILVGVNARLQSQYGSSANLLTIGQVWAVFNAEMGLTNGKVNAHQVHSEGERGLFPLPENVEFWNGKSAPAWNKPMPLVQNVEQFMLYLGQLKNKKVAKSGSLWLYRDLFNASGIKGKDKKEMRVLAGVVHGYFYGGTYKDKKVPRSTILKGIAAGKKISTVMAATKYVHAGKKLMVNREMNLAEGFGLA